MSLLRAAGTIGVLTLASRIAGFARDMLLARLLGAGMAADAFNLAFKLPNIFRRLFAEGAFSAAFVPAYSQQLREGGPAGARRFASDVLGVFLPVLLLVTALAQVAMPALVWVMNGGGAFRAIPGKFELAVELTRLTFPYLLFISLTALLGGILNGLSRFAAAAAAPILLNLCLIGALLLVHDGEIMTSRALGIAVSLAGMAQFLWLLAACARAGAAPRLGWPRLSPAVRRLGRVILPATFGAGIYQVSQFVDLFFASRLPQGSLSYLNYADRLNQLPLGVVGIAVGTAILPALSRHLAEDNAAAAQDLHNRAVELALLLTVPAAVALMLCATPITEAIYLGGRFSADDALWTARTLAALAAGLPAYVLLKVLTPGFYARADTATPMRVAAGALLLNILLNLLLIGPFKVAGLAMATAIAAWVNCVALAVILRRRGHYRTDVRLKRHVARILLAAAVMAVVVWLTCLGLRDWFSGPATGRIAAVAVLLAAGLASYFGVAIRLGVVSGADLAGRFRRQRP